MIQISVNNEESIYEYNQDIEVLIDVTEPFKTQCWITGKIKSLKGNFYLVEYDYGNKKYSKIIPNTNIRKKRKNYIELTYSKLSKYQPDFGDMFSNDNRKINHLIQNINNLVSPLFLYYSEETLYYLLRREQDEALLMRLLETAKEHYVIFNNLRFH